MRAAECGEGLDGSATQGVLRWKRCDSWLHDTHGHFSARRQMVRGGSTSLVRELCAPSTLRQSAVLIGTTIPRSWATSIARS